MNEHPEELLPWYANHTLADDERVRVERHLADCARCRAELQLLSAMRREVQLTDAPEGPGELARERLLRAARRNPRTPSRWLPLALAASVAVIAVQAALLLRLWAPEDRYTPLGAPVAAPVLQIRFVPDATEREIRAALTAAGASIVEGPSALGLYRVRVGDARDLAVALERLRAQTEVIAHAEREP